MKDKILVFIIGLLVGAIITAAGFLIYEKINNNNKVVDNGRDRMFQMPDGDRMFERPENSDNFEKDKNRSEDFQNKKNTKNGSGLNSDEA